MSGNNAEKASSVSTGAGIAIAGIWTACTAATVIFALMVFEWDDGLEAPTEDIDALAVIIVFLLIASPMIAAASMTRLILNKE